MFLQISSISKYFPKNKAGFWSVEISSKINTCVFKLVSSTVRIVLSERTFKRKNVYANYLVVFYLVVGTLSSIIKTPVSKVVVHKKMCVL